MGSRMLYVVFYFIFLRPTTSTDLDEIDIDNISDDRWTSSAQSPNDEDLCLRTRPTNSDIIKRFRAILPYFDKEHSNSAFLRKFRGTVYGMSDGDDLLDKEAAFYAAVLTPLIFLQNYRDTWCLLERFHRALRLYQTSHPTEKRSALKLLQNFRAVNHKSAFAAPSVGVNFYSINSVEPVKDNGQLINSFVTDGALAYIDGGDVPLYAQMAIQSINDMANSGDPASQSSAILQTIVSIGELANGVPGDACEAAALINASVSGNSGQLRSALAGFAKRIASYIDIISQLVVNPNSVRYSAGPRGNCLGGGRSYRFEEAWDVILANANAYQIGLLNEEYCAAKRLYNAFNIRSNNLSAALTAAAGAPARRLAQGALAPLVQFLRVVVSGANPSQAGAVAKDAVFQSLSKIQY